MAFHFLNYVFNVKKSFFVFLLGQEVLMEEQKSKHSPNLMFLFCIYQIYLRTAVQGESSWSKSCVRGI